MKYLINCCLKIIKKRFNNPVDEGEPNTNQYCGRVLTFKEIYNELPIMLSSSMAESLSLSVAFYCILHLANDCNLQLSQGDDHTDFKIHQLQM